MDIQAKIIYLLNIRSEQAIPEMMDTYGGLCYKMAGRFLSSREDIEEIINDTMLVAWNKIPPEQPVSLAAFLSKITRNLAMARLRNNRAAIRDERLTTSISELEDAIPSRDTPYSAAEERMLSQMINVYLSGIGEKNRYIFVRRYYYMDDCKEIARLTHLSHQAVRKRLMRMRGELREYLEKEGVWYGDQ